MHTCLSSTGLRFLPLSLLALQGTHFVIPWIERPIIFDVRTRPRAIKSVTGTRGASAEAHVLQSAFYASPYQFIPLTCFLLIRIPRIADLQMVDIGLRVLTRPDSRALPSIYRRLGPDYDDKVLPSIVTEVVKQVIAQFNATALLTQREQVSKKIKEMLAERASEFYIVLEDVSITDLKFGREFELAVERKQVAQQDAERARFVVEKAMQDKQSTIVKAKGEAQAAELIGKAVAQNPGFVQLRRIETAVEVAKSLAESQNTVYLPAETLLLNLQAAPGAGGAAASK